LAAPLEIGRQLVGVLVATGLPAGGFPGAEIAKLGYLADDPGLRR
jgi:hypothetical protein